MSMQVQVIKFISEFTGISESKISMDSLVNGELGVDGDDGHDLLLEFSNKFEVDLSTITETYFGPEGFNPFTVIYSGFKAFFGGLAGKEESIKPLPVKQLVKSAEAGKWVNI